MRTAQGQAMSDSDMKMMAIEELLAIKSITC
jgi:hypothetical protein